MCWTNKIVIMIKKIIIIIIIIIIIMMMVIIRIKIDFVRGRHATGQSSRPAIVLYYHTASFTHASK